MILVASFVFYTVLLVWLGRDPKKRGQETFRDGGRQLSPQAIFLMVTALWGSSLIVVEIDTAYTSGLGAVWYGISVALMSILVSLLMPWFLRQNYISNSALLGKTFGPAVKRLSGLVIGATFPIFALSNALAAAVFLRVALNWPLWWSFSLTTAALVLYIQFAGIVSLARTQGLNFGMVMVALGLALDKFSHLTPRHPAALPPAFWHWFGIGHGLIWVWFGMNTLNVFAAQAEIQAVAASRNIRQAQWAVWLSTILLMGIIGASTWLGMRSRILFGHAGLDGLVAFAHVLMSHSSVWFITIVGLGIWALALTWCGPLLFSGAISLGGDVFANKRVIRWTRVALVIEGIVMVLYGGWRPEEVAWWRVFGLTLRNAAVVGPTFALFLWEDLSPKAVVSAMVAGIGMGLGLNAWTGFSATHFIAGVNPMWSAATTTFMVLAVWRLGQRRRIREAVLGVLAFGAILTWMMTDTLGFRKDAGFVGVMVLLLGMAFMGYAWLLTKPQQIGQHGKEAQPAAGRVIGD